jgi:hypothetical protein
MNSTVDEMTKSTGKLSLFDCTTDDLKQLVNQYPFFAPAKFLLAKKMKENNSFLFEEQIQKVSIYFQNPVWLDHVLNGAAAQAQYEAPAIDIATRDETEEKQETAERETTETETLATTSGTLAPGTEIEEPVTEEPATFEEIVDQTTTDTDDEVTGDQPESTEQPALAVEMPKFKFEPVDPSKSALTFEPYHTIDYFASQGIKAKEEDDKPKDRLTRQLRSFTEWIKTMKRLPESEITAAVSATDEKKVEKMAEVSIHDREVVTEAMAEVWEKQGNIAKATAIYQKLSLLNPGKSSYFASKIEQLKNL